MNIDAYTQETGTLKNKFGIIDQKLLAKTELQLTVFRIKELIKNPLQGDLDYKYLKAIHRHIFQDVYYWAGQPRTINIRKMNTTFCPVADLETKQQEIFDTLKKENYLKNLPINDFVTKAAAIWGQINYIHFFREGNGRTQREFMRVLSLQAGYDLNIKKLAPERMIYASREAIAGDFRELESILKSYLTPLKQQTKINTVTRR